MYVIGFHTAVMLPCWKSQGTCTERLIEENKCLQPLQVDPDNGVSITHNVNPAKWDIKDDCCILRSADIGQEFVISEKSDVENWAKEIILSH